MPHRDEVAAGERFEFGDNWRRFLEVLDDQRIAGAEQSFRELLGVDSLAGKTFLDIGSGSGLMSLVARRLGATVRSFDYDPASVACTRELRARYFGDDPAWRVEPGSALDPRFMAALGQYDCVYSWGVLHHTGAMWVAIEHAIARVAPGGTLCLALYNDQGWKSHFWWFVKFFYNLLPAPLNRAYGLVFGLLAKLANIIKYTLRLQPMQAIRPLLDYRRKRGMSILHDMQDWMGGFPFEFVRYQVLVDYMAARGYRLVRGREAGSLGCHEWVFRGPGERPAVPG